MTDLVFDLAKIAHTKKTQASDKPPFLFVHGNSQNSTCGHHLMEYFFEHGHDVFAYDLPGHGDSPMQTENYTFDDLVDLNQAIIKLHQLENPILCGHSLGGMIQAETIVKYNVQAKSLILCGSYDASPVQAAIAQSQPDEADLIVSSLDEYIKNAYLLYKHPKKYDYFSNRQLDDESVGLLNRRYTNPKANERNLLTLKHFNARSALSQKGLPILVLHGEAEDVIPATLVNTMRQAYDNLRVEWYPQGGHYAFYQAPELTAEYLTKHYQHIAE